MSLGAPHKKLPKKIRQQVYGKYNGHCAYCGKAIAYKDMQVDHVIPKYREESQDVQTEDMANYMPACRACNFYKGTMGLEKFRQQLGMLTMRLDRDQFTYRLAKSYGLVQETPHDIRFYFEGRK